MKIYKRSKCIKNRALMCMNKLNKIRKVWNTMRMIIIDNDDNIIKLI